VIGSGDPSMGTGKAGAWSYSQIISDYLAKISEAGIKKINGDIVVQTAVFQDVVIRTGLMDGNGFYTPIGIPPVATYQYAQERSQIGLSPKSDKS
jgi:D-alanyl-D-alanine carboxypeptidase/D-alanyl-D-alanine-endopeptidase (penicillin-binding protein 4)